MATLSRLTAAAPAPAASRTITSSRGDTFTVYLAHLLGQTAQIFDRRLARDHE